MYDRRVLSGHPRALVRELTEEGKGVKNKRMGPHPQQHGQNGHVQGRPPGQKSLTVTCGMEPQGPLCP